MIEIEILKNVLEENRDKPIDEAISKGHLKLNDDLIETISFIFWLCYMAEIDLDETLRKAWEVSKMACPDNSETKKYIKEKFGIDLKYIDVNDTDYSSKEITFGNRIDILDKILGKTNRVKLLWKLKKIRDAISHTRIDNLKYNDNDLILRETKENLLLDYFRFQGEQDFSKSKILSKLSDEQKIEINQKFEEHKDKLNN